MTEAQHYNSGGTLVLTVDYSYDGFGNLIEESAGTLTTKYAVDGWNPNAVPATGNANFNDWAVLNSGNTLQTRNIFGNDASQILARVDQTGASDPAGTYWDLTDREGSVRDVINNSGTVKDSLAYDAWGNVLAGSNANPTYAGWYQWTGQQRDAATGLQLNDVRWYDPTTGRWQSQDPLGFDAGDSNLYRYVNNRPDVATDPSGLQTTAYERMLDRRDMNPNGLRNGPSAPVPNFFEGLANLFFPPPPGPPIIKPEPPRPQYSNPTANDVIGRAGGLLILTSYTDVADNVQRLGPAFVDNAFTAIIKSGVTCNAAPNKTTGFAISGPPVTDLQSLTKVIMKYSDNGEKQYNQITIWGHCGGAAEGAGSKDRAAKNKQSPGAMLAKAGARLDIGAL